MGWDDLFELARRNRVVTYADAAACGISRSTLDDVARRQGWPPRPQPGVLLAPGGQIDEFVRITAAFRSLPEAVGVGGDTALFLHGLQSAAPTQTLVWVPDGHVGVERRTRKVRRTSLLTRKDCTEVAGIPTVLPAWAMRDVAGARSVPALRNLAIDARFRGLLAEGSLDEVLGRDRRFVGRRRYAEVADDLRADGSDSGFEFSVRDRLVSARRPPDAGQERLWTPGRPRSIDLPYRDPKVGVECLGWRYHSDRDQLDRDAERNNDIAAAGGWLILQLTWGMQWGEPWRRFLSRLDRALASRGWTPPA